MGVSRYQTRYGLVSCNEPDGAHQWISTIRGVQRTFNHIARPKGGLVYCDNFMRSSMLPKRGCKDLPLIGVESKAAEKDRFSSSIWMSERKEVSDNLLFWNIDRCEFGELHQDCSGSFCGKVYHRWKAVGQLLARPHPRGYRCWR